MRRNIVYSDFQINNLCRDITQQLHPIFQQLLPNNSKASFRYHIVFYFKNFLFDDPKTTIVEEKERFKSYIINKYMLEHMY